MRGLSIFGEFESISSFYWSIGTLNESGRCLDADFRAGKIFVIARLVFGSL